MVKLRARCIIVGDAAVGKSALSQMFRSDGGHFQKNYSMGQYIFDSAGRETFVGACEKMWGQPSVVCVVFDITSLASFNSCSRWLERVRAHCNGLQVPGVLVGNKSDLSSRREVEAAVAQEWAQSQGLQYHETSAKDMENCDAPLLSLAQAFYSLYQDRRQMIQGLG
ncbi:intraflagellar transport protein 27 homolog isoform X2 [Pygocentrus nattereri]|uniref:intraflagellar transport protein 27 homolog isoform X2 n=1 Tax=Pygocentrus nattereri TaxID=42514 RepID=UPI001891C815|nr:intraflagellar transport protein 27 homolog isoform X2 [Pygocentrus nattereri]